jgi:hypothetical protein
MFADFRVHGLNTTFSNAFTTGLNLFVGKEKGGGFAHLLQPMYAKAREHGAPVQGTRLAGKPGKQWVNAPAPR